MYPMMLSIHSGTRWLLLATLIFCVFSALKGSMQSSEYGKADKLSRTMTVIFAHLQLVFGLGLYFMSPMVKGILHSDVPMTTNFYSLFFAALHPIAMVSAIVLITIGSALARRSDEDSKRFKIILRTFGAALIIILLAIPWSFYPEIARPLFR